MKNKNFSKFECIDAGTEYCPCYLAKLGECYECPLLRGEKFCDCKWRGICKYYEYIWSTGNIKLRKTVSSKVLNKDMKNDILFLRLKLPHTFLIELKKPGSYVFIRPSSMPPYFDLPVAVMYVNETYNYIELAVKIKGPKTKALSLEKNSIMVRGPYYNGIIGLKNIENLNKSKCVLILSGMAQTSAVLLINELLKHNNIVFIFKDKLCPFFIKKYINSNKIEIQTINLNGNNWLKDLDLKDIDFIYVGGCRDLQDRIFNFLKARQNKVKVAFSNNNRLCCGEGICGSCEITISGYKLRSCKIQFR
ncbi:conserved hypothetical protein [Methanothermus fervidus DSM 2088]|uniref:FAD-binding FR-type domain-containing protein n=1 Tax=Methanothermus fervidus (strain ATCC 43054 / DSM 2088 / JCM 10308 / V24 S) TaxID=523846 RepID=E3GYH9_METFV|nr:hypothetical protein [Methanothermus fervidus]ADP77361.1 conserved hypothetical protein [Methanothermus fervidus DSM 2088]